MHLFNRLMCGSPAQMSWFRGTVLCRYIRTAAKDFWMAAPRATGALEVIKVVPKVSPGPLRSNHCIFTVSMPAHVLGVLADCQLVPATGRSIEARDPGLQAHPFRACPGPQILRMQLSPYPRTRQSVPVTCLYKICRAHEVPGPFLCMIKF